METVEEKFTRMMEQRRKASRKYYATKITPVSLEELTEAQKIQREKVINQKRENSKKWRMRKKALQLADAKIKPAEKQKTDNKSVGENQPQLSAS